MEDTGAGPRLAARASAMGPDGRATAAIAVQGPTGRITDDRLGAIAELVRTAAGEVSGRLVAPL